MLLLIRCDRVNEDRRYRRQGGDQHPRLGNTVTKRCYAGSGLTPPAELMSHEPNRE
jgi:hypothetical protein